MVESGDAEAIFRLAIEEQGRGQVGTYGCTGSGLELGGFI